MQLEYRKKIGALSPFDPSALNVHPDSRPKVYIRISKKRRGKLNRLSKKLARPLSDEEWEGDIAEGDGVSDLTDDDDVWSTTSSAPRRGSKRLTIKLRRGRSDLPFSPRKTRPHRRALSESESSELGVRKAVGGTRQSNRIRNSRGTNTMDRDYENSELDTLSDSDEYVSPVRNSRSKGKVNIPKRGKASRAAYGHIRSIADLEYDELEGGPLSAHRHTCERCQRKPTHILLEQQRKRKKPKRKPKDEFEEYSDGEDKLASLGGWVRWQVCVPMP